MKIHNFSAGPSKLPEPVIRKIQDNFADYNGMGVSITEISHRSDTFLEIYSDCLALFKALLNIPDRYHILFLHGGCSLQYAMIPLNFIHQKKGAYIDSGIWSQKAFNEAHRLKKAAIVASGEQDDYLILPKLARFDSDQYDYLHYTWNNTIYGTEFNDVPKLGLPLIVDATSNIASRVFDLSSFQLVYGGCQKNLGVSGLGFAILDKESIFANLDTVPKLLQYQTYIDSQSMFNTPNTFAIYVLKLVLEWIKEAGGVDQLEKINIKKANLIYGIIDEHGYYINEIPKEHRSRMNICFRLKNQNLEEQFIKEAENIGIKYIKGHKLSGGIRLSMYNAMPLESIEFLAEYMLNFKNKHR